VAGLDTVARLGVIRPSGDGVLVVVVGAAQQ
jgi:hypothetical protein